ncbi:MAG: DEAD/DEAH box helicase [Chlamydiales bacterium]|nr:DEAD/DEAH box helicase [Chlamydiales bacterium]
MVSLPKILEPYKEAGKSLIKSGAVKEIEFSGATYQVLVEDPSREQGVWAFMQLDETGSINDCFCGCDESDENAACRHLAAAYFKVFNGNAVPLHLRFEHSIWHQLCSHYAEKIGYDSDQLKKSQDGGYEYCSISGKRLFSIRGVTKEGKEVLRQLMETRLQETEETSLKFSNLSQSEIQLWREGRPSLSLLYHLSFWNDLARWMMVMQDRKTYDLTFEYSAQGIPNYLIASFTPIKVEFYLPEALLPPLIPALAEVKTPMSIKDYAKDAISKITYDEETGCLVIDRTSFSQDSIGTPKGPVIRLGEWLFSKDQGFVHTEVGSLLSKKRICGDDVSELLRHHYLFVKDKLDGVDVHPESVEVSYHLSFDSDWNLHIRSYLFEPGDLQHPRSRCFGSWAYLAGDGFYRLRNTRSGDADEVISSRDVSDFVTQNRVWLSGQEGFSPHLANIESELSYEMDADGNLHFTTYNPPEDATEGQRDFGRWLYIAGQGFFAKVGSHLGLPVRPGVVIRAESLGLFIHMNKEELQLVPRFFSSSCPIIRSQVRVMLTEKGISVIPVYELEKQYQDADLRFYGDYVYNPGEGFSALPLDSRLPEDYRTQVYIDSENEALFLAYELDRLKPYIAYLDPRLHRPERMDLVAEEAEIAQQGKGWYSLRLSFHTDRGVIPVTHLWKAITNKERFLFSEAGLVDLHDPRFVWLHSMAKQRIDLRKNSITLSTMELIRLNVFDEIKSTNKRGDKAEITRTLLRELMTFEEPEEPDITGLASNLRPYQEKGVRWLWFLYHHGLSGMLCDDMGLGKTHQSMALMAALRNDFVKRGVTRKPRFLVICPTSVLYHWEEKLQQFLPGIRVHMFYGLERNLEDFTDDCDVLLTSYGIWRREVSRLKEIKFDLGIFDEVQAAKSQASRLHHSLLNVHASMRLGLTGTPIENHLMELKALFDVVLPTYMPSERDYREFFIKPIEKDNDIGRRQLLSRLIKPFMLRRKKEDVLTDLPEKTEEIAHCELSVEQRKLYREVLDQGRQALITDLSDQAKVIPYVHIFAILTQLKRICNHPAVYLKTPSEYRKHESGKWELFVELLSEARDSGQKVVVFSQYLAMLDIFEEYLKQEGISFAAIRGSTTDRGEQLKLFNQDPTCEVFLGSLQAVGLGVDLTAASVVIHYDRWWNAARENQATDRVHRIGQRRGVQVFKLVTKGTFEERIDALINAKGQLMEDVVGVDDQDVIKRLDRRELIELLQYVDTAATAVSDD